MATTPRRSSVKLQGILNSIKTKASPRTDWAAISRSAVSTRRRQSDQNRLLLARQLVQQGLSTDEASSPSPASSTAPFVATTPTTGSSPSVSSPVVPPATDEQLPPRPTPSTSRRISLAASPVTVGEEHRYVFLAEQLSKLREQLRSSKEESSELKQKLEEATKPVRVTPEKLPTREEEEEAESASVKLQAALAAVATLRGQVTALENENESLHDKLRGSRSPGSAVSEEDEDIFARLRDLAERSISPAATATQRNSTPNSARSNHSSRSVHSTHSTHSTSSKSSSSSSSKPAPTLDEFLAAAKSSSSAVSAAAAASAARRNSVMTVFHSPDDSPSNIHTSWAPQSTIHEEPSFSTPGEQTVPRARRKLQLSVNTGASTPCAASATGAASGGGLRRCATMVPSKSVAAGSAPAAESSQPNALSRSQSFRQPAVDLKASPHALRMKATAGSRSELPSFATIGTGTSVLDNLSDLVLRDVVDAYWEMKPEECALKAGVPPPPPPPTPVSTSHRKLTRHKSMRKTKSRKHMCRTKSAKDVKRSSRSSSAVAPVQSTIQEDDEFGSDDKELKEVQQRILRERTRSARNMRALSRSDSATNMQPRRQLDRTRSARDLKSFLVEEKSAAYPSSTSGHRDENVEVRVEPVASKVMPVIEESQPRRNKMKRAVGSKTSRVRRHRVLA